MSLYREELVTIVEKTQALSAEQAEGLRKNLFGWTLDEDTASIWREFKLNDFADAWHFTNRVALLAEEENHHPTISFSWGWVRIEWATHKIGGLHKNDFIMAARCDDLYERWENLRGNKDAVQRALEASFPASDP